MEKRVLIERWLSSEVQFFPIYDDASVSSARQRVREAGAQWNAPKALVETVALIASELTHNQLRHAKQGYFGVRTIERAGTKGLEVIAADIGPGIAKPAIGTMPNVPQDGSLRAGLGSVFRLADEVDMDSRIEEGACITARKFQTQCLPFPEIAVLSKPYPGEGISGDDAVFFQSEAGLLAGVCDGLGHGPEAREASNRAMEALTRKRDLNPEEILIQVNAAVAGTRGGAISLVRYRVDTHEIECVAAGDVHVQLYTLNATHFFTPAALVLRGNDLPKRKLRVERAPVNPGTVMVMFTDGLSSKTNLKGQVQLLRKPVVTIAQHLIETEARITDDALVLVARFR